MKNQSLTGILKKHGALLAFVLMVLIFTLVKNQYFTVQNFRSILIQASMLGIIAGGMTIVMMTGGADLSVGSVAGLATLAGMWPVVNGNTPLAVGILIALGVSLVIGMINGLAISRLGVAPFVSTLGTMFLAQGAQYMFSNGGMALSSGFPAAFKLLGKGSVGFIPMPVFIFLVVFAALLLATEFAPVGRYLRGTGLNQFASELSGVRTRFFTFLAYVLCSLLAAILGLVLCSFQTYASPDHGSTYLMDSLLVVLLGKTLMKNKISVYATAFGALFLKSFEAGLSMVGLPTTFMSICKGSLLMLVLLLSLMEQRKVRGKNG